MPIRPCLEANCGSPATYRGRCPQHARTQDQAINRAGRTIYNKHKWKRTRERILFNQPLCARCGSVAEDVHHLVDLKDGGDPYDPTNLEPLCHACHSQISRRNQLTSAV